MKKLTYELLPFVNGQVVGAKKVSSDKPRSNVIDIINDFKSKGYKSKCVYFLNGDIKISLSLPSGNPYIYTLVEGWYA